jgi:probable F420-dependent oxidoreductase
MAIEIGPVGVWISPRTWPGGDLTDVVAELEGLGYRAFWRGGSPAGDGDLRSIETLLAATSTITIGTSIVNVWTTTPEEVTASYHRVSANHPDRFILGIGAGHREATAEYTKPYARLTGFLDAFDHGGVPVGHRMLAALGPRVLTLAADRTAGAQPYLVPPEHTRRAREILGPGPILAPEQKVVLETDPARARTIARETLRPYLGASNYTNNFRRLGFTEEDLAGGGSDRLVDAVTAWGDEDAIRARVAEHRDAGADHVAIQVLNPLDTRMAALRALAPALVSR